MIEQVRKRLSAQGLDIQEALCRVVFQQGSQTMFDTGHDKQSSSCMTPTDTKRTCFSHSHDSLPGLHKKRDVSKASNTDAAGSHSVHILITEGVSKNHQGQSRMLFGKNPSESESRVDQK